MGGRTPTTTKVITLRHALPAVILLLSATSVSPKLAAFQTGGGGQPTENVEVEPVTCWWRTSTSAVRVGQPFDVVLTCSALETEATKAVIDRARLASAAVQLPPYEVTGGSQSDDITTATRRFMQYEYTLRLIGDDVFGAEVPVPPLQVSYRIESTMQQSQAVQGREQTYILPPIPIRVASLVASSETHIREAPVPTLTAIAARQARGALLRTVGVIVLAVSGLLLVVAAVRSLQQRRSAVAKVRSHLLSDSAVLAGVRRELQDVQQAARGGWNDTLAARALAATRITASYAAGQPVAQRVVGGANGYDGQLVLRRRFGLGSSVLVSGAATAKDVAPGANGVGEELRSALSDFTVARYGRGTSNGNRDLDDAVERGLRATAREASRHTLLARLVSAARRSASGWREKAWAR
jgi:hypothetical protein